MLTSLKFFILISILIFVEGKPTKHVKECIDDSDCKMGFHCINARKFGKLICAKRKTANLDYTNAEEDEGADESDDYYDKGEG